VIAVVPVREWSSPEAATPEPSASRKTPTTVAASEAAVASAGEANGGPCCTASQREHQESDEKQDRQPTVPMSCDAGHDQPTRGNCRAGRPGDGTVRRPCHIELRARVPLAMPNGDADMSALADMSAAHPVDRSAAQLLYLQSDRGALETQAAGGSVRPPSTRCSRALIGGDDRATSGRGRSISFRESSFVNAICSQRAHRDVRAADTGPVALRYSATARGAGRC